MQEITVLLLNQHGLLPHYQLALQTLTPLALELSNRKNMAANEHAQSPSPKRDGRKWGADCCEFNRGLPW
ncbi:MAG: hypothetical protein R3E67_06175 [Pseudomonadales bacterium]